MKRVDIEPMKLSNMCANGVRSLAITCAARLCHHQAILDVANYSDDVPVPYFGPCTVCTV